MDFKNILASLTTIAEGETKETEKGRVHKGDYGTEYDTDREGNEKKKSKPEVKKGRGRPKKDSDETGEVKKYDTKSLGDVFGGGKKPKKDVGTVSKKHSLKEYMESVEAEKEQLSEMMAQQPIPVVGKQGSTQQTGAGFLNIDDNSPAGQAMKDAIGKLAQQKKAQIVVPTQGQQSGTTPTTTTPGAQQKTQGAVSTMVAQEASTGDYSAKKARAGKDIGKPGKQFGKIAKDAAKRYGSKERGEKVAGAILAKLRGAHESVEEETNGMGAIRMQGQHVDEKAPPGAKAERMVKHIKKSYSKDGKLTPKEKSIAYATAWKAHNKGQVEEAKKANKDYDGDGKIESGKDEYMGSKDKAIKKAMNKKVNESITLEESPETLQHIINRFKNEVKRFINGDELDSDLYEALFDYYSDAGEMPYGTAKGRTGDPFEWVTQRFDQDVQQHVQQPSLPLGRPAVEEGDINPRDSSSIQMHRQHALAEPTSSFQSKDDPRMAVPRGTPTKFNRPAQNPTPWGTDPIAASGERVGNFLSSLGKGTKFTKEGTEMKDIQLESWEKQLNGLLTEGITVSSSQGQQGSPDSVSVTATDGDAESLMSVLRNAGIGGFGAEKAAPEIGYGVAQGGEEEPTGTGTEPEASPEVVGDGDDMLALIKKLTGMGDAEVVAVDGEEGSEDYADEEGEEDEGGQDQTLEPADSGEEGEESHDEEDSEDDGEEEEQTDEGNAFGQEVRQKKSDNIPDSQQRITTGGQNLPVKEEGEETCNECGMMESECECDHEAVEEGFSNDAGGDAMGDTELAKLKALLSMGGDLHKMKHSQAVGNPIRVAESEITDWKKLSGIK